MSKGQFKSYKQVEKWLRDRTTKEFFITCSKGNDLIIVITRENKLKVYQENVGYWSWFTESEANKILSFIERD